MPRHTSHELKRRGCAGGVQQGPQGGIKTEQWYALTAMTSPPDQTRLPEVIFLVEEAPEGGFIARALGESIFTEADDVAELHAKVRDAVRCHFDEAVSPKVIRLHFVREEVINT